MYFPFKINYYGHFLRYVIMYISMDDFRDIKHPSPHPTWPGKSYAEGFKY